MLPSLYILPTPGVSSPSPSALARPMLPSTSSVTSRRPRSPSTLHTPNTMPSTTLSNMSSSTARTSPGSDILKLILLFSRLTVSQLSVSWTLLASRRIPRIFSSRIVMCALLIMTASSLPSMSNPPDLQPTSTRNRPDKLILPANVPPFSTLLPIRTSLTTCSPPVPSASPLTFTSLYCL